MPDAPIPWLATRLAGAIHNTLLLRAGVEPNPGPTGADSTSMVGTSSGLQERQDDTTPFVDNAEAKLNIMQIQLSNLHRAEGHLAHLVMCAQKAVEGAKNLLQITKPTLPANASIHQGDHNMLLLKASHSAFELAEKLTQEAQQLEAKQCKHTPFLSTTQPLRVWLDHKNFRYSVKAYQRDYKWDNKQAEG